MAAPEFDFQVFAFQMVAEVCAAKGESLLPEIEDTTNGQFVPMRGEVTVGDNTIGLIYTGLYSDLLELNLDRLTEFIRLAGLDQRRITIRNRPPIERKADTPLLSFGGEIREVGLTVSGNEFYINLYDRGIAEASRKERGRRTTPDDFAPRLNAALKQGLMLSATHEVTSGNSVEYTLEKFLTWGSALTMEVVTAFGAALQGLTLADKREILQLMAKVSAVGVPAYNLFVNSALDVVFKGKFRRQGLAKLLPPVPLERLLLADLYLARTGPSELIRLNEEELFRQTDIWSLR